MCHEEQGGWQLKAMGGLLEGPEPASRFTQVYRQGRDYVVVLWQYRDAQGLVPEYGYFYRMNNIENKDGSWYMTGLDNAAKLRKDFWDTINNKNKVSINLLTDNDVEIFEETMVS